MQMRCFPINIFFYNFYYDIQYLHIIRTIQYSIAVSLLRSVISSLVVIEITALSWVAHVRIKFEMFCQNTRLWLVKTDCDCHRYIQMAFQTQLIEDLKTDFSALISTIFFHFRRHRESSLQMICLYNTFQFILIETCNSKISEIAVMRWLNFQNKLLKQSRVWIKIILIVWYLVFRERIASTGRKRWFWWCFSSPVSCHG